MDNKCFVRDEKMSDNKMERNKIIIITALNCDNDFNRRTKKNELLRARGR